jgi:hypothetical protein
MNTSKAIRTIRTEVGAVLQNTQNGATFSINLVGARIWDHLTQGATKDEVVDLLCSQFAVAKADIYRDVDEFLTGLQEGGLIEKRGSKS